MTQNASDVEIANQGFAAFRQDLNDVLEDITTLHSGTAAPSTTYANQWWYETDTDKLYIRNEDNDAWIEILTLDQANDHLASLGATFTLDGSGNASIDGTFDVNGNELILDADGDTSITADTDDRIDFKTGGTDAMHINASQNVGIGAISPDAPLVVEESALSQTAQSNDIAVLKRNGDGMIKVYTPNTNTGGIAFGDTDDPFIGALMYAHSDNSIQFYVNNAEHMRIDNSGNLLVGKTSDSFSTVGVSARSHGEFTATRTSSHPLALNRLSTDGNLVLFYQNTSIEGSISVSGTTVSYNGGHLARWSQLTDNTKDEAIVKGTVMTNLDQMAVWSHDAVEAQDAVYDEDGNVVTEAVEAKDAYTEDNEQLNCMAVSSVEGDPNVAGVFVNWDNDDDEFNDMNIAMTGDMVIRIAQGTTVARGDLLMSAGDGTAKPQGDDIVRSKTIAKVTSTNVSHTYDDGSYCVPCVLMAC
jgi:hypothetical protein